MTPSTEEGEIGISGANVSGTTALVLVGLKETPPADGTCLRRCYGVFMRRRHSVHVSTYRDGALVYDAVLCCGTKRECETYIERYLTARRVLLTESMTERRA